MYQHPGVYIEHVPSGALSIEAASTSVTAFVGDVGRGVPVNATNSPGKPVFISSMGQYAQMFGPAGPSAGGIKDLGQTADEFGHAVSAYFANGGTKAYIVPIGSGTETNGKQTLSCTVDGKKYKLTFTATSPGAWSIDLLIVLKETGLDNQVTLMIGTQDDVSKARNSNANKEIDTELEVFSDLSLVASHNNFITNQVDGMSSLVTVAVEAGTGTPPALPQNVEIKSGGNATGVKKSDYETAFEVLKDYRDVSIVVLPGRDWDSDSTIFEAAITHAEFMQNRMVIVDPGPTTVLTSPAEVKTAGFPTSPYAALYYPNLTVKNPYYDADIAANLPKSFKMGPAAFAAGLWARIDGSRGVWKAPAGLEATVRGSLGPTALIGNALQDNLNEWGVNCLRAIIGPTVIWGGRTLATKTKPQYRYIPVRRTQSMIGESLYRALQAVVFEPNDHKLWGSLRGSVGDFMDGLHRAGAFQGAKASDAYFVKCGLGSTMTQGDIDAGIVRVEVGFAALKPAEFVVVQISQKVGQAA